jgi:hypothetical protein
LSFSGANSLAALHCLPPEDSRPITQFRIAETTIDRYDIAHSEKNFLGEWALKLRSGQKPT